MHAGWRAQARARFAAAYVRAAGRALVPAMGVAVVRSGWRAQARAQGRSRIRGRWPVGPRPCPARGSRTGAARLRMGGEEESTRTGDSNPGCNYLVRGFSPSMHFFRGGDMRHYSPPLPLHVCLICSTIVIYLSYNYLAVHFHVPFSKVKVNYYYTSVSLFIILST